jgi:hypothetical protein
VIAEEEEEDERRGWGEGEGIYEATWKDDCP